MSQPPAIAPAAISPCQSCGACCAYDASWPRFSLEAEEDLALIPENLVAADKSGMRWDGHRCAALSGEIGRHVGCTIYGLRPDVCRACQPGDPECNIARARYGFAPL
ncbi:YkgJ family cysteine cluster protein [Dongia sp.]|jgi:Fe-S-cluster containining protein|uniref:YkgJ family cysteine cluster protein n=1 Tax=Dongia sp. TaxID=1977262 RepID=UPI0035B11C82